MITVENIEVWQQARLDTLEAEVEAISAAVIALNRLDGLFDTRGTISIVEAAYNELEMQATNRQKLLDNARKPKPKPKSKAKASVA